MSRSPSVRPPATRAPSGTRCARPQVAERYGLQLSQTTSTEDGGAQSELGWVQDATSVLYRFLPDLEAFDLTVQAVHGLPIGASDLWLPLAYGAGYAGLLLLAAIAAFERRDFR